MERLRSVLGFGGILSRNNIEELAAHFNCKPLTAGEHAQEFNRVANEVLFVENGIMRVYTADPKGNEITKYFIRENQFFVDLESYYTAKPSSDAFQAVTDSRLYAVRKSVIEQLTDEIPNLYIFIKSISEASLLNKIKDNDFLNFGDAKTKYLEFLRRHPDLAQHVPQQYIASYLKITPQSLSRLRKRIVKGTPKKR